MRVSRWGYFLQRPSRCRTPGQLSWFLSGLPCGSSWCLLLFRDYKYLRFRSISVSLVWDRKSRSTVTCSVKTTHIFSGFSGVVDLRVSFVKLKLETLVILFLGLSHCMFSCQILQRGFSLCWLVQDNYVNTSIQPVHWLL